MNIRAMQYLVTLADVRHFSKAAERCFVSQPTLSTQIRKLEEELGVQLVERSPRHVMLTPVGEEVVARCRGILAEVDAMKSLARRAVDPEGGLLRVGIFPTLAPYLLPHVIPNLRRQFPKLTIRLFEEKTEDILEMLLQGRLDAGVLALPVSSDQVVARELFEEPFVVAMPEGHSLSKKDQLTMSDLEGQELLLLEDGHCLREHALEVCQMAGAHEKLDFHATSMETLRQMVAANTGITLMPVLSVKPPVAPTENLITRPFGAQTPRRKIAMIWRKSSALSDFLEKIAHIFASVKPGLLKP